MSWNAMGLEWLLMKYSLDIKELDDENLVIELRKVFNNSLKVEMIYRELSSRGILDKLEKEHPELWI